MSADSSRVLVLVSVSEQVTADRALTLFRLRPDEGFFLDFTSASRWNSVSLWGFEAEQLRGLHFRCSWETEQGTEDIKDMNWTAQRSSLQTSLYIKHMTLVWLHLQRKWAEDKPETETWTKAWDPRVLEPQREQEKQVLLILQPHSLFKIRSNSV